LRAAAAREPYVLYRRHEHRVVRDLLRAEVLNRRPDFLYLDHLDSLIYRDVAPHVPAVLDFHNVYSSLARRAAADQRSFLLRRYLRHESVLLGRVERRAVASAEVVLAVSEDDRRHLAGLGFPAVFLVPNGVDCSAYETLPVGRPGAPPVVLFLGALSWGPNLSAARFLARVVFPEVRRRFPEGRLWLVGKDPLPEIAALGTLPGVEVFGSVPDVIPYLRAARLLAVPLESGGGTRLKILEAFAAGLPVVSTPVGCEGLDVVPGEHLVVTARAQFGAAVCDLLEDQELGRRLAASARALALRYGWEHVGETACAAVASLLAS
jgi:glycosyltransferase involved in cell wall biosynthesis